MIVPSWISSIASDDDAIAQIVVDDSRQHLYTRSSKGVLIVYDLGKRLCVVRWLSLIHFLRAQSTSPVLLDHRVDLGCSVYMLSAISRD